MTVPAHVVARLRAANGTRRPTSEPLVGDLAVLDGTVDSTVGRVRSRWAHRGTLWLSVEAGSRLLVAPVARARRAAEPLPPVGGTFLATTASQAEGAPPRAYRPSDWPAPAGALRTLMASGETLYEGFHRRLIETRGVVATKRSSSPVPCM